jgi:hypothetical protein
MLSRRRALLAFSATILLLALGWRALRRSDSQTSSSERSSVRGTASSTLDPKVGLDNPAHSSAPAVASSTAGPRVLQPNLPASLRLSWGSAEHQVGRTRPSEGNPEAPMSLAFGPDGSLYLVDQVNSRVTVRREDGSFVRSFPISRHTQDLAVGETSIAALDRHGEKELVLYTKEGVPTKRTPLGSEGGVFTGVFLSQASPGAWLEREHGMLRDPFFEGSQKELSGRPMKDGKMLVSAWVQAKEEGMVGYSIFEIIAQAPQASFRIRNSRTVRIPDLRGIAAVDSDANGVIYLAFERTPQNEKARYLLHCLDSKGARLGQLELSVPAYAEEVFREFAVRADGLIAFAHPTETEMVYDYFRCP